MSKKRLAAIILAAIVIGSLFGIRAYNSYRYHVEKETRFMMDTYVTMYAVGPKKIASKGISLALKRMQEIDAKFNLLNPKSPIYAFNHEGTAISDPEILGLVRVALEVSRLSEGAFDITVSPLVELWGFYTKSFNLPTDKQIKEVLKSVGYQHLALKDSSLEKDKKDVAIDLGGIAKGYALSQAVKVLKENGVKSALIDAGGDVYALGRKGNKLWRVGIRDPRGEGILGYVEVDDLAVVGSGDYERFFIRNDKRYHHIFNPKTGYPTEGVASVTLIYPDPILAQTWTKIPFVMGQKKGLEILEQIPGIEALIITSSGEKIYSSGLKNALKVIPKTK